MLVSDAATSYQCAVTVTGSALCGRQVPAKLRVGKRAEAFRSRELTDDEKVSVCSDVSPVVAWLGNGPPGEGKAIGVAFKFSRWDHCPMSYDTRER
jgi:hypothetical protein